MRCAGFSVCARGGSSPRERIAEKSFSPLRMSDVSVRGDDDGAGDIAAIDAVRSMPPLCTPESAAPHTRQISISAPTGYLLSHWGHARMAAYRWTPPVLPPIVNSTRIPKTRQSTNFLSRYGRVSAYSSGVELAQGVGDLQADLLDRLLCQAIPQDRDRIRPLRDRQRFCHARAA